MIVLMFHDVISTFCPISGFQTVGANQYRLDRLAFEKIVDFIEQLKVDVVYSFDDGGVSFLDVIAPILEKYNKKGVFCITTSCIGRPGFLSEKQIKTLEAHGHLIASHSHSHPRDISKLSEKEIFEEWSESKRILETIVGKPITIASIPGGAVSKKVINSLFKAGYSEIYTSEPSNIKRRYSKGCVIGRFAIKYSTSLEDIQKILNGSFYRYKLLFDYRLLKIIKALMGNNYNIIKQKILKKHRK